MHVAVHHPEQTLLRQSRLRYPEMTGQGGPRATMIYNEIAGTRKRM